VICLIPLFTIPVFGPSSIQVDIDIKPGSDPNSINPSSEGVIPVVILSSNTFSSSSVVVSSIEFGPGPAIELHSKTHLNDVNNDGLDDLMLHFSTGAIMILSSSTELCISGFTIDGTEIEGCDSVVVVPKK